MFTNTRYKYSAECGVRSVMMFTNAWYKWQCGVRSAECGV